MEKRDLIVLVGAMGAGKPTALTAGWSVITTSSSPGHIITVENPIELTYCHKKLVVARREISIDTHNYENALRSAMRRSAGCDSNGRSRDRDVMKLCADLRWTGHLVLFTLHVNNANGALEHIVNFFLQDV